MSGLIITFSSFRKLLNNFCAIAAICYLFTYFIFHITKFINNSGMFLFCCLSSVCTVMNIFPLSHRRKFWGNMSGRYDKVEWAKKGHKNPHQIIFNRFQSYFLLMDDFMGQVYILSKYFINFFVALIWWIKLSFYLRGRKMRFLIILSDFFGTWRILIKFTGIRRKFSSKKPVNFKNGNSAKN